MKMARNDKQDGRKIKESIYRKIINDSQIAGNQRVPITEPAINKIYKKKYFFLQKE